MGLKGQAIITGASSGTGKATVEILSQAGMKCVLTGRSTINLAALAVSLDGALRSETAGSGPKNVPKIRHILTHSNQIKEKW